MLDAILAALMGVDSLDERFIAHRHKSSRLALGVGVTLITGWFTYDLMVNDRMHLDLLVILVAMAAAKLVAMAWFRLTE
jgi:hypothetical protein